MKTQLHRLIFVALTYAALGLIDISGANAQTTAIRASFTGATRYHLPIWLQKQEALDRKYGLDMDLDCC